jgi:propionyl-CoA carboxylase alpha chain
MVTGLDLVELMIRVAAGERLPLTQGDIRSSGWAIECRINAEDPLRTFLPSVGRLVKYLPPADEDGAVRVDSGVAEGGEITIHYDSLIAKLICHGATREAAMLRMRGALDAFAIRGVFTTIGFHAAVLHHPRFLAGDFTTGFMAEAFPQGFHGVDMTPHDPLLFAGVAAFARMKYIARATSVTGRLTGRERAVSRDWVALMGTGQYTLRLTPIAGGYSIACAGKVNELVSAWRLGDILFRCTWNGHPVCLQLERRGLKYRVSHAGATADITVMTARDARLLSLVPEKPTADLSRFLISPMPGLVTELAVEPGQEVKAGEKLAVIEAMKMENILRAEHDCVIAEVLVRKGESLAADQPILRFK